MQIFKAADIQKMDEEAKAFGIDGILLMEHAALALLERIQASHTPHRVQRIVIVCGPGNNGGDGFALARLLDMDDEYEVCIVCNVAQDKMSKDEAYYARIVEKLGIHWIREQDEEQIRKQFQEADWIVDALFGTGLTRSITGWYAWLMQAINDSAAHVLAVDIPSGLLADQGDIAGCCVVADETVTFAYGKLGLFIKAGSTHCGKITIRDIGIPRQVRGKFQPSFTILEPSLLHAWMPKRTADSHKGTYGKGLIIGGSEQMSGALYLASQAALRCGIGTLTMMMPRSASSLIAGNIPEAMRILLDDENGECLSSDLSHLLPQYDVIAIGNGIGRGKGAENLLEQVLASDRACVIDGDALFLLGKHKELLKRKSATILTPHPKEVSYLTGISIQEIKKNPSEALKTLDKACYGATIIMKDTKTMISADHEHFLNIIGNDGLAKGGSGDVLCGLVLGWLAQTKDAKQAACLAVYLHALCADLLRKQQSTYSILPRDLLEILPQAIQSILEYA